MYSKIDFSELRFKLKEISESRILSQYSSSPVYKLLLEAFTSEVQELLDAIVDLMESRTLYDGNTYTLNIIGKIVGQNRVMQDYDNTFWFSPDNEGVSADNGYWWVNTTSKSSIQEMDNVTYRKWLWLKILENHNLFSAKPEIEDQIKQGLGETVAFVDDGIVEAKIIVEQTISLTSEALLTYYKDTQLTDNDYLFAYQATTEINSVEKV